MITHLLTDEVEPVLVGPGCIRRDMPTIGNVRAWVVDMEPGSEWPNVDHHDERGEELWVASGELIEGDERYSAGSYLLYHGGSCHRPRTETGVRLFGFNLI